jgi:hypothetical protein
MEFHDFVLAKVLTVSEVCTLWGKGQKTVMMAIHRDKIIARQAAYGRAWMIYKPSVIKLWGEPIKEVDGEELE